MQLAELSVELLKQNDEHYADVGIIIIIYYILLAGQPQSGATYSNGLHFSVHLSVCLSVKCEYLRK